MMQKYKQALLIGFQNALSFRVNFFLSLGSAFFPILMQVFLWLAVFNNLPVGETQVYGFTMRGMITYVLTAAIIAKLTDTSIKWDIHNDIKEGGLSKFIIKPVGYLRFKVAQSMGQKAMPLFIILTLLFLCFTLFAPYLELNLQILNILLFLVSIAFALVLSLGIAFIVSSMAFWLTEAWALFMVLDVAILITSGGVFPLELFGATVNGVLKLLPFQYMVYFPTNIIKGVMSTQMILSGLLMQCVWIFIVYMLNRAIWNIGLKKYVAVGG